MKAKNWLILVVTLLLVGSGGGVYFLSHPHTDAQLASKTPATHQPASQDQPLVHQQPATVSSKTTVDIRAADPAGLFGASYSQQLDDFTPWKESTVQVNYADFNADGAPDAFVWSTLPGTAGTSFAAVWTTDASGNPKELWHLSDNLYVTQSTWSVSNLQLVNSGKVIAADGSIVPTTHTFIWQSTGSTPGFILQPPQTN
jgi:hypothetical protein